MNKPTLSEMYAQLSRLRLDVRALRETIKQETDKKYPCPKCGSIGGLEYVFDEVQYASMDYGEDGTPSCGEVYEQGDSNFHHISCCCCDTYWESTADFAAEVVKGLDRKQKV